MPTATARDFDDMGADDLDNLYKLFVEYCRQRKEEPTLKDFHIWAIEMGYIDD